MTPTIHIANWSSTRLHGPGPKLTIMARPRPWERGDGTVLALVPRSRDLDAVKAGRISLPEYRSRYELDVASRAADLAPGVLLFERDSSFLVPDGSTLLCACPRDQALKGRCHRAWAAEALARAGWRVIADGREVGARGLFGDVAGA